jgi:uncharacterized protein
MSSASASERTSPPWYRRAWRIARPVIIAYLVVVLAMLLLETWLVYPAPPVAVADWNPANLGHEDVWFASADGTQLHGWFVPRDNPKRAILYCHGNGEHIAWNADLAARLRDRLDASVFLFDYRGYGQSAGRPSETGCIADGRAAQHWLADRLGKKPSEIVLMGRSLGAGVAVALAASEGAEALVLENAFTSLPDVAARQFPWLPVRWLMKNRYDSLTQIQDYSGPLLQVHAGEDRLVPVALGRKLFAAAQNPHKQFLEFAGLGHNSEWPADYYDTLASFLDDVDSRR